MQERFTLCGCGDAGEDFKQGGLAGAVATHNSDDITFFNLKAHILERPEIIRRGHAVRGFFKDRGMRIRPPELASYPALDLVDQHLAIDHAKAVFFRKVFDLDYGWHGELESLFFPFDSVLEL